MGTGKKAGVPLLILSLLMVVLMLINTGAGAQTITVDPTTPQGIFDAVIFQTLGVFTAGNIVGLFIKLTNRS